jgi:hypothetical protein
MKAAQDFAVQRILESAKCPDHPDASVTGESVRCEGKMKPPSETKDV